MTDLNKRRCNLKRTRGALFPHCAYLPASYRWHFCCPGHIPETRNTCWILESVTQGTFSCRINIKTEGKRKGCSGHTVPDLPLSVVATARGLHTLTSSRVYHHYLRLKSQNATSQSSFCWNLGKKSGHVDQFSLYGSEGWGPLGTPVWMVQETYQDPSTASIFPTWTWASLYLPRCLQAWSIRDIGSPWSVLQVVEPVQSYSKIYWLLTTQRKLFSVVCTYSGEAWIKKMPSSIDEVLCFANTADHWYIQMSTVAVVSSGSVQDYVVAGCQWC